MTAGRWRQMGRKGAWMAKSTQRKRLAVEDASLADVARALGEGTVTASGLARAYLARIKAYDRARNAKGPRLNSVREINPDALAIAASLDGVKPSARQPLAGVPILVKDNIATGDRQHTTAGFAGARECARPGRRHGRQAAARGGGGDPGQGEPHGVRQHPRGRHALGLQLARRPGEEPVCANAGRRSRHPGRAAGRLERGLRRRRRGRPVRRGDRHRDLGLAAEPRDAERRWSP